MKKAEDGRRPSWMMIQMQYDSWTDSRQYVAFHPNVANIVSIQI